MHNHLPRYISLQYPSTYSNVADGLIYIERENEIWCHVIKRKDCTVHSSIKSELFSPHDILFNYFRHFVKLISLYGAKFDFLPGKKVLFLPSVKVSMRKLPQGMNGSKQIIERCQDQPYFPSPLVFYCFQLLYY